MGPFENAITKGEAFQYVGTDLQVCPLPADRSKDLSLHLLEIQQAGEASEKEVM